MPYAWGSRTAIATLQGRPSPSATPEAELWMGAHPGAPAMVTRQGSSHPLDAVIASSPGRELGDATVARFGARLPFLLKVLAAEQPLSLQAHPTETQAREGFADEERRGVPITASHRNYKDPHHKPELICALTPFDALCGFREARATLALLQTLGSSELRTLSAPLATSTDAQGVWNTFRAIMALKPPAAAQIVSSVTAACMVYRGPFEAECAWAQRLATQYPGDRGVLSALLLNLVHLNPGEGIYLGAGQLHAYLSGVGIELMASSDNVLRGGLTTKHVDVPELMKVLTVTDGQVPIVHARRVAPDEDVWDTPAPEFRLSRVTVAFSADPRAVQGPEILLCTEGAVRLETADGAPELNLARGDAAFVPYSAGTYTLSGTGVVFRATTGL